MADSVSARQLANMRLSGAFFSGIPLNIPKADVLGCVLQAQFGESLGDINAFSPNTRGGD
jgi:hypothetical protein